jgi:DNA-binding MarR family transcriptional regulator
MDYEVVYSAQLEREVIESQRRFADSSKAEFRQPQCVGTLNTNQRVLAYLARYPNGTLLEIVNALGVGKAPVNGALHRLLELGYVARSHSQKQNRREHIRWRIV